MRSTQYGNVAKAIVAGLADAGVEHVFGVPGGAIGVLLDAIHRDPRIDYVTTRHEGGAAYMADGYHRATGKLGVVAVTSGPGATNAITGLLNAHVDGSAMLVISGEVPRHTWGRGFLQEGTHNGVDLCSVFRAATGESILVSDGCHAPELVTKAFRQAQLGRAVHLSMPNDVAAMPWVSNTHPATGYRIYPPQPCSQLVQDVAELLTKSRRPLVYLGGDTRRSLHAARLDALQRAFESHQIPVVTSATAKGIFPESHPLSLRVFGFASCTWPQYYLDPERANGGQPHDALVVVGSALNGLDAHNWTPLLAPEGKFIQVSGSASSVARSYDVDAMGSADLGSFFDALAQALAERPMSNEVNRDRKSWLETVRDRPPVADSDGYASNGAPIHPLALMRELAKNLPPDTRMFVDCGNCVGWVSHALEVDPPFEVHTSLNMAPMGFAVAAVVGAKLADPTRTTVCVTGDGSLLMHLGELSTAVAHQVGVIWIVLHDNDMRMVTQGQTEFFDQGGTSYEGSYALKVPDLAATCQGLGCEVQRVSHSEQLAAAIARSVESAPVGPQVIIVDIDPSPSPPYYDPSYFVGGPS